jgi:hypothetical protein
MSIAAPSVVPSAPLIGWQTLLADLSLILFMVTAAAMASAPVAVLPRAAAPSAPKPPAAAPRAEPLALWRASAGGMGLGAWLATQAPDPRQQLTVTAHYPPGEGQAALEAVRAALAGGSAPVAHARIVLEADAPPGALLVMASLAYDSPVSAERPR